MTIFLGLIGLAIYIFISTLYFKETSWASETHTTTIDWGDIAGGWNGNVGDKFTWVEKTNFFGRADSVILIILFIIFTLFVITYIVLYLIDEVFCYDKITKKMDFDKHGEWHPMFYFGAIILAIIIDVIDIIVTMKVSGDFLTSFFATITSGTGLGVGFGALAWLLNRGSGCDI